MLIDRVTIFRIRNLSDTNLQLNPRFNLFYGRNGAGKTAILESIHLLSDARTFRHSQIRPLIQDGMPEAVVRGELVSLLSGSRFAVGVSKRRNGQTEIRGWNQQDVSAVALARRVPMLALVDQGDDWVRGGSRGRRQMLDWGLFHVEHRFYPAWQRMRQAVKQRNRLLRHDTMEASQLAPWEDQICQQASVLHALRSDYFQALEPQVADIWRSFLGEELGLKLRYLAGWDQERELAEVLRDSVARDLANGYTTSGPHRADLTISTALGEPERVLSRGQMKMAYWGLRLAQLALHGERTGEPAICLVDDLPAELDRENQERLTTALWEVGAQVFITALEAEVPMPSAMPSQGLMMFHVKQGAVQQAAQNLE